MDADTPSPTEGGAKKRPAFFLPARESCLPLPCPINRNDMNPFQRVTRSQSG